MSFFTDFVVVNPKKAKSLAHTISEDCNVPEGIPSYSLKSLDTLHLANLYGHLLGKTSVKEVVSLLDEFDLVFMEEDGITFHCFPSTFVSLLVNLKQQNNTKIAATWSGDEEFGGMWETEFLNEVIDELCRLARNAADSGDGLYVCISGV